MIKATVMVALTNSSTYTLCWYCVLYLIEGSVFRNNYKYPVISCHCVGGGWDLGWLLGGNVKLHPF